MIAYNPLLTLLWIVVSSIAHLQIAFLHTQSKGIKGNHTKSQQPPLLSASKKNQYQSKMSLPPPVLYPHSNSTGAPPSHSKNSYGPVLIILAGIIVLGVFACFIGRLCACLCPRKAKHHHNFHKHDTENGFGRSIHTANPTETREKRQVTAAAANGETREAKLGHNREPISSVGWARRH